MKRFDFTDIARGLAILYIIQCHAIIILRGLIVGLCRSSL